MVIEHLELFAAATAPLDRSDAGRAQFPGNDTIVSGNNGHQFGGGRRLFDEAQVGLGVGRASALLLKIGENINGDL